jgi:hypothetical protein
MTPFAIRIPTQRLILPSSREITSLIPEFCTYLLKEYARLVSQELSHFNRYKNHKWEEYGESFKKYMTEHGMPTELPLDESFFLEHFTCKQYKYQILLEVDARKPISKKYPTSILPYLKAVEYGTTAFPARPLLVSVRQTIEKSLQYYWDSFIRDEVESQSEYKKTRYDEELERRKKHDRHREIR